MYSNGPPHMAVQKQDDQHEHTFSSYVRIRDVVLKTCLGRWKIGRSGKRGSGISVLPARHDDDDDVNFCERFPYLYEYVYFTYSYLGRSRGPIIYNRTLYNQNRYYQILSITKLYNDSHHGMVINVLDCKITGSEFKLQICAYIH